MLETVFDIQNCKISFSDGSPNDLTDFFNMSVKLQIPQYSDQFINIPSKKIDKSMIVICSIGDLVLKLDL